MQLIRFFLFLIVAGFGAAYLYWAPVRFVEDGSSSLKLAPDGYTYQGKIFSGFIYKLKGFQLMRLAFVEHGQRHGPDIQWYGNGQRFIERHYSHGLESGIHRAWFQDGRPMYLKSFETGKPQGEFYEWHANGQLAQFILFSEGKEIAAKSWTAGGKPFYNYVWSGEKPLGMQGDRFCTPTKKRL